MSDLRIKANIDCGDWSKKLSIKKCSCCYHPPTKEYSEKFIKNNLDLFPEFRNLHNDLKQEFALKLLLYQKKLEFQFSKKKE